MNLDVSEIKVVNKDHYTLFPLIIICIQFVNLLDEHANEFVCNKVNGLKFLELSFTNGRESSKTNQIYVIAIQGSLSTLSSVWNVYRFLQGLTKITLHVE